MKLHLWRVGDRIELVEQGRLVHNANVPVSYIGTIEVPEPKKVVTKEVISPRIVKTENARGYYDCIVYNNSIPETAKNLRVLYDIEE